MSGMSGLVREEGLGFGLGLNLEEEGFRGGSRNETLFVSCNVGIGVVCR